MAGARSGVSALVSAGQKFEKAEAEKLKSWSRKQGKKKTKKSRKKENKKKPEKSVKNAEKWLKFQKFQIKFGAEAMNWSPEPEWKFKKKQSEERSQSRKGGLMTNRDNNNPIRFKNPQ